jgi:hypothetical protein
MASRSWVIYEPFNRGSPISATSSVLNINGNSIVEDIHPSLEIQRLLG